MTLAGDVALGGRPLGLGGSGVAAAEVLLRGLPLVLSPAVATAGDASLLGLLVGLGEAVFGMADELAAAFFAGDRFAAAVAAFFGAGDTFFLDLESMTPWVSLLSTNCAVFGGVGVAVLATTDFFRALATFLAVDICFTGEAFFTFAVSSAAAFFTDATAFLGERRTGGFGVGVAFVLPVSLPFLGDGRVVTLAIAGFSMFLMRRKSRS